MMDGRRGVAVATWLALLAVSFTARADPVPVQPAKDAAPVEEPADDDDTDDPAAAEGEGADEPGPAPGEGEAAPEGAVPDVIESDPEHDEVSQFRALERMEERLEQLYPVTRPLEDLEQAERSRPSIRVGSHVHGALGTEGLQQAVTDLRIAAERMALEELARVKATVPQFIVGPLGPATTDIPLVDNDMTQHWVRFFQGVGSKYYRKWMARYWRFGPMMRRILEEQGLPSDLVFLSMIESGFSPKAYSVAHAAGPWQFIRGTGTKMGLDTNFWVDERRDPIKSTYAAAKYLKSLHQDFGDWHLAWASYNAGPGKVRRAMARYQSREFFKLTRGRYLRWETKNYVPKLIAAATIAKDPTAFGFTDVEPLPPFEFDTMEVADSLALTALAKACGTELTVLQELNPELRRPMTPPREEGSPPYVLRVPKGQGGDCRSGLATLTDLERTTYRRHRVRPGDTMPAIAQRFGTSEAAILVENNLPNAKLRPGEDLLVPVPPGATRPPLGDMFDDTHETRGRMPRAPQPRGTTAVRVTVRRGDTLWDIASAHGVDVQSVASWNGFSWRRRLRIGQKLVLYVREPKKR